MCNGLDGLFIGVIRFDIADDRGIDIPVGQFPEPQGLFLERVVAVQEGKAFSNRCKQIIVDRFGYLIGK